MVSVFITSPGFLLAAVNVTTDWHDTEAAMPGFRFKQVPPPARNDAGSKAKFSLVDGRRDLNGGNLDKLQDGRLPDVEDQPSSNFFFRAGTAGGRIAVDLSQPVTIQQINSYSWHPQNRGPQVYVLYASAGTEENINSQPKRGTDPETCGWTRIASVDTRPQQGMGGGQHGVSISSDTGDLGTFRHLLFDISLTENRDPFGNTFYSEIDIYDANAPAPDPVEVQLQQVIRETIQFGNARYKVTIDTSETPDLTEWTQQKVIPMVTEWYPRMVKLLPSEGFQAPASFSILFDKDMRGVAATGGRRIRCSGNWMRQNQKGEALGALFHEMIHVIQQYGSAPRSTGFTRPPGWLTEGITDYVRFFIYEPETLGAEITRRNFERARYDGSYRITANFLNWTSEKHDQNLVPKLNAIIREGKYNDSVWKDVTGQTVQELGKDWKAHLAEDLGIKNWTFE